MRPFTSPVAVAGTLGLCHPVLGGDSQSSVTAFRFGDESRVESRDGVDRMP